MMSRSLSQIAWLTTLSLSGCVHRTATLGPARAASARDDSSFLDLKPGYRLRVITPITKSGRFTVSTSSEAVPAKQGEPIVLKASEDFLGYETAYYDVVAAQAGIRIQFTSATRSIAGTESPRSTPIAQLFNIPRGLPNVRLVYLTRQSNSDHDMAVLAADSILRLGALTDHVRQNPAACGASRKQHCSWVPAGIAVRPEFRSKLGDWQPVR